MIGFLFASLGSLMFWAVYFMISLFVGTFFIRKFAPRTLHYIKTGYFSRGCDSKWEYIAVAVSNYLFWPFILIGVLFAIAWKFVTESLIAPAFRAVFNFADKVTPNIDVKIVKDNNEPF